MVKPNNKAFSACHQLLLLAATSVAILGLLSTGASESKAGTAIPGESFAVSYLDLPRGSVAGVSSGSIQGSSVASPLSASGRYSLFVSYSNNLARGASRFSPNIYRRDNQTGTIVLVNRRNGANGAAALGLFGDFAISDNGNLVAFPTQASLVAEDADPNLTDVYIRNIVNGTTTLATPGTTSEGVAGFDLSGDGGYLAFQTKQALVPGDLNGLQDIYRIRLVNDTLDLVSRVPGSVTAGSAESASPSISGDGRWVAFSSRATNLVSGYVKNNGVFDSDIFIRDVAPGSETYLVSSRFNSLVQGGNEESSEPDIAGSPTGPGDALVVYSSYATNLADDGVVDPDGTISVYRKQLSATSSDLISRAAGANGASADRRAHTPSISNNGERIIFSSDANNLGAGDDYYGVYLRDTSNSATSLVSAKNNYAVYGVISANGSKATWGENGASDDSDPDLPAVFIRDLPQGVISMVSRPKGRASVHAPGFIAGYRLRSHVNNSNANGRYVVFEAFSSSLPGPTQTSSQIYRRDLKTGKIIWVSPGATYADNPSISSSGNLIAFETGSKLLAADTNIFTDVYLKNVQTKKLFLISINDDGIPGNENSFDSAISGSGQSVAFLSEASNLGADGSHTQVYQRNLSTGKTKLVSRASGAGAIANDDSEDPSISYNGQRIGFLSRATNLHSDDLGNPRSAFVRNLNSDNTLLVSRTDGTGGASLVKPVYEFALSGNGATVAFTTEDSDAVPASAPWPEFFGQVVLRDIASGANSLQSVSGVGAVGNGNSTSPTLSEDGRTIAYTSNSTNIRPGTNFAGGRKIVVVKKTNSFRSSGPPLFRGSDFLGAETSSPSISPDGNCLLFLGVGVNEIDPLLDSLNSIYNYTNKGRCLNPRLKVPQLSKVRLQPKILILGGRSSQNKAARISFRLSSKATLTVKVLRLSNGRKSNGRCVKKTSGNAGQRTCSLFLQVAQANKAFSPGARKMEVPKRQTRKAGRYQIVVQAKQRLDSSIKVTRALKVLVR